MHSQTDAWDCLKHVLLRHPAPRYWIAYSGGMDSHVLLHLCATLRDSHAFTAEFHAVHIHHGLQTAADAWTEHCALSYAVRMYQEGVKVVAIPKTMDNDVPGTDYCIGFSTCVTRTIALTNTLRTTAGSHERFLILEVFGRYAGYTAILPTMAGAANRCVIPEFKFDIEHLTELLSKDRMRNPSRYSVVLVSEGATYEGGDMVFESTSTDAYGHAKLGGIGDLVAAQLKDISPRFNNGQMVDVVNQKLGYMVRGGDPDAIDSIVPMAFGNLALDLILKGVHGRLVVLKNGRYDNMPLDVVTASKKTVNVSHFYDTDRYRPKYENFEMKPLFIMTGE